MDKGFERFYVIRKIGILGRFFKISKKPKQNAPAFDMKLLFYFFFLMLSSASFPKFS
jgi:hypothetical protein